MKKVILIVIGSLGGLYALFGTIQLIITLLTSEPGKSLSLPEIVGSVIPVLLGLIVCVTCFEAAFRKPKRW